MLATNAATWTSAAAAACTLILAVAVGVLAKATYAAVSSQRKGLKALEDQAVLAQRTLTAAQTQAAISHWALKAAQDQSTIAGQALDAQTEPFLTADEKQDPEDLGGRDVDSRGMREGEGEKRWRIRVINAGQGTAVITRASCADAAGTAFGGLPQVGQLVLRPGKPTHVTIVADGDGGPDGGVYHFDLEYRDVNLERVRGAVRIEMACQDPGIGGWVQRIAWADSIDDLDSPKFEEERQQPFAGALNGRGQLPGFRFRRPPGA